MIEAVMKGKGKGGQGGGFQGTCYKCGEYGHSSRYCTKPRVPGKSGGDSKGESKGKGKGSGFQGSCYTCGEYGHSMHNCPKGMSKGGGKSGWYGKSGWGGKGQGISLADYWPGINMGGSVEGVDPSTGSGGNAGVSEIE